MIYDARTRQTANEDRSSGTNHPEVDNIDLADERMHVRYHESSGTLFR